MRRLAPVARVCAFLAVANAYAGEAEAWEREAPAAEPGGRDAGGAGAGGAGAVGPSAFGSSAVGPSEVGSSAVGPSVVGPSAVGPSAVRPQPITSGMPGPDRLSRLIRETERVQAEVTSLERARAGAEAKLAKRTRLLTRLRRLEPKLAGGLSALLRHRAQLRRLGRILERDLADAATLRQRYRAVSERHAALAAAVRAHREAQRLVRAEAQLASLRPVPDAPPPPSPGAFLALRGRLPLPATGPVTLADVETEGGAGLSVTAGPTAHARAVAAGRVAFAGRHPDYGLLVVLKHGTADRGGYFTVYGGLATLAVRRDQRVLAHAPIGGLEGALFFQVRRGSVPLDTRAWLGV